MEFDIKKMASLKIFQDIENGVQKTLDRFRGSNSSKKIIEIEITPNVEMLTNRFFTPSGLVIEKIIRIRQSEREKSPIRIF